MSGKPGLNKPGCKGWRSIRACREFEKAAAANVRAATQNEPNSSISPRPVEPPGI